MEKEYTIKEATNGWILEMPSTLIGEIHTEVYSEFADLLNRLIVLTKQQAKITLQYHEQKN